MKRLIDSHCHIYLEEFRQDLDEVIENAKSIGICKLLLPNINPDTVEQMLMTCHRYPGLCYPMIGLHPTDLSDHYGDQLDILYSTLEEDRRTGGAKQFIGIGEIGLDLYWDKSRITDQIDAFQIQIEWALKFDLPIVVHARNAFDELYGVMSKYKNSHLKGIFHCFSGSPDEANVLLGFDNFLLGVGGTVTYKKSDLPEILKNIPLCRIALETDSPFLPPVPYRGKRNEPSYLKEVVSKLSLIYDLSDDEIADTTTASVKDLFGI